MNANAFRHFYDYHFAENRKIWDRMSPNYPMNSSRNRRTTLMGLFETKSFIS